jgi:hypothetical protein
MPFQRLRGANAMQNVIEGDSGRDKLEFAIAMAIAVAFLRGRPKSLWMTSQS